MDDSAPRSAEDPGKANREILHRIGRDCRWFRARKTRPIWAKRIEANGTVETLEGLERVCAGDFLCRGDAGLPWPQSAERLAKAYVATSEVDGEWRKLEPNPDSMGVLAARLAEPCEISTRWGTLAGKTGDYVVKNYEDRDVLCPADVWIVERNIFESTYERIGERHVEREAGHGSEETQENGNSV
jgi:hypothetical protein